MSQHAGAYKERRLEPLLDVDDVSLLLKRHRSSVYALVNTGELTPIRVGKRMRFDPADIRAYLHRNREVN